MLTGSVVVLLAVAFAEPDPEPPKPVKGSTEAKSPDGTRLAKANKRTIDVYETRSQKVIIRVAAHRDDISDLKYSPDGKCLASADKSGVICLLDSATGKMLWKLTTGNAGVTVVTFTKAGDKLEVTQAGGKKKTTYDARTGKALP